MNMVEAEQVQDAVNQKFIEAQLRVHARRQGLFGACVHGYDDVPQQLWMDIGMLTLPHGKRDDIGGTLVLKVHFVEAGDLRIIDQHQRQFAVRTAQGV